MIYNKKNYWYKKNNNDLLSLSGQEEIIKKYAKGFGSSVYNYTTDLNNIYQTLSYNYRFNIVPKKDISLFGKTYTANKVYNLTKNVKTEDILSSKELRTSIRNGDVVAMDARMDNDNLSDILLDTVCYKENLYNNKNFTQVIITITNPINISFGSSLEIFLNTPQYNIDGILSTPNTNIKLGTFSNHIVASNPITNKVIAKYIYDYDINQAQYYIEYTELSGIADSFLTNIYTMNFGETLYKIETFDNATITTSNDNTHFVSDKMPVYTNYTSRIGFNEFSLSLILADSQIFVSKDISTYNFVNVTKNADYDKATYHLPNNDITLYAYLLENFDDSFTENKTDVNYNQINYFLSTDLTNNVFYNYHKVHYFIDDSNFVLSNPLIIDNNVILDGSTILIQNQGLYEYKNNLLSEIIDNYTDFKAHILYGNYANIDVMIETDNNGISDDISKHFVVNKNFIIRNKSEYTLPKDMNFNKTVSYNEVKYYCLAEEEYVLNIINDGTNMLKVSPDNKELLITSNNNNVTKYVLGGDANKKIFKHTNNKYILIDKVLYILNTSDIYNITKTTKRDFSDYNGDVKDISFYDNYLYICFSNNLIIKYELTTDAIQSVNISGVSDEIFAIEYTNTCFYAATIHKIYELNTKIIIHTHQHAITELTAYNDVFMFTNIHNEKIAFRKGNNNIITNINSVNDYNFTTIDKTSYGRFSIIDGNKLEVKNHYNDMIYLDGISDYISIDTFDITKLDISFIFKIDGNITNSNDIFYLGDSIKNNILPKSYLKLNVKDSSNGNKMVLQYKNIIDKIDIPSKILEPGKEYKIRIVATKTTSKYIFELIVNDISYKNDILFRDTTDIPNIKCLLGASEVSNNFVKCYIKPLLSTPYTSHIVSNDEIYGVISKPHKIVHNDGYNYIVNENKDTLDYVLDISGLSGYGVYENKQCLNITNTSNITIDLPNTKYVSGDTYKITIRYYTDAYNDNILNNISQNTVAIDNDIKILDKNDSEISTGYVTLTTNKTALVLSFENKQSLTALYVYSIRVELKRNTSYFNVYKVDNLSNHYSIVDNSIVRDFVDITIDNITHDIHILTDDELYTLSGNIPTETLPINNTYKGVVTYAGNIYYYSDDTIFDFLHNVLYNTYFISNINFVDNKFYILDATTGYKNIINHLTNTIYNINNYDSQDGVYDYIYGTDKLSIDKITGEIRLYSTDENTKNMGIDTDIVYTDTITKTPVFVTYDSCFYLILDNKLIIIKKLNNHRVNYDYSNIDIPTNISNIDYAYVDGTSLILGNSQENKFYISSITYNTTDSFYMNVSPSYKSHITHYSYLGDNSVVFIDNIYRPNISRSALRNASYIPNKISVLGTYDYYDTSEMIFVGDYGTILKYDISTSKSIFCQTNKPVFTHLNHVFSDTDKTVIVGNDATILFSYDNMNFVVYQNDDDISLNYKSVVVDNDVLYITTDYGNIRVYKLTDSLEYLETIYPLDKNETHTYSNLLFYKNDFIYVADSSKIIFKNNTHIIDNDTIIDITLARTMVEDISNYDSVYILGKKGIYTLVLNDKDAKITKSNINNIINLDIANSLSISSYIRTCGDSLTFENGNKIPALNTKNILFTDYNLARKSYILNKDKSPKIAKGTLSKPGNCYYYDKDDVLTFSDKNIRGTVYNYTTYQDFYYLNSRTINTPGSIGEFENGFRKYNKSLLCVENYDNDYTINIDDYNIGVSDITINSLKNTLSSYTIYDNTNSLALVSTNIINNNFIYILAVSDNSIFTKGDFVEVNGNVYLIDSKSSDNSGTNYIKFIGNDDLIVTNYTGVVNLIKPNFIENTNINDVISVKVLSNIKNRYIVDGDRLNLNIKLSDIDLTIDSESDVTYNSTNNLYSVSFDLKTTVITYDFEKMSIQEFSDNFRQYKLLSDYIDYTLSTRNAVYNPQETKVIEHLFEAIDFVSTVSVRDMIFINNKYYILSGSFIHIYDINKNNLGVYNIHGSYKYLTYNKKYNSLYLTGDISLGIYDLNSNKIVYSDDLVCDTAFYNESNGYIYINNIATNTTFVYDYKSQLTNHSMVVFAIYNNILYYYDYASQKIYDINNTYIVDSDEPIGVINKYIYTNTNLIDISTYAKTTVIKPHLVEVGNELLLSSDKTIYLGGNSVDILDEIKDIVYTDYIYVLTDNYISCYNTSLELVSNYMLGNVVNKMKTVLGETFLFSQSDKNFTSLVIELVEPRNASVNINSIVLDETYVVIDKKSNSITINENFTDDVLYDLNNKNNYVYIKNISNFGIDMMSLKMNFDKHLLHEAFNMDMSRFNYIDISSNITDYNRYFNLESRATFNGTTVDIAYNDIYGMNYTLLGILPLYLFPYQFATISFNETYTKTLSMNNQFSIYKNTIVVSENIVNNLHLQKNLFVNISDSINTINQVYISKVEKILYTGKTTYYYVISTNRDLSKLTGNNINIRVRDRLYEISDDLKYTDTTMYDIENKYVTNYLENIDMTRYHEIIKNDTTMRDFTSAWVGFDKDNVLVMDIYNTDDDISLNYRPVEILQMGSDNNLKKAVNVEYTNYDISNNWFGLKNINIDLFNYILMDGLTVAVLENNYEWILNAYIRDAIIGLDKNSNIIWYKGHFLEGDFVDGTWYSGYATNMIFNNGVVNANRVDYKSNLIDILESDATQTIFKNCVFDNGNFNNGYMYESTFNNGNFNNGTMSGEFKHGEFNGNFIGGNFTGNFNGGVFSNTRYNSVFLNGVFTGEFGNGIFMNGVLKDALFGTQSSSYKQAIMEYGYIINSTVTCGTVNNNIDTIINNANIESCVLNGGVIRYSNWNNGTVNAGVFDTDNEIVDISIRNDIASLTNTFVNITLKKPHFFKTVKYKNKEVSNFISIMGVPRIFNGKIDKTTLSLGYNNDVKKHFVVEIVDEYTVTIELEKEFPYNEITYTYTPYKTLSINEIPSSSVSNTGGEIINNKMYIHNNSVSGGIVVNDLNILNPSISSMPGKYCVDPNTNDVYDISGDGTQLNKNGDSYLSLSQQGYEIFYNTVINRIVIVAEKVVFLIDSNGYYTFITHSTLPQTCINIYMFDDNIVFDTTMKMIHINLNTGVKTAINANTSLRVFKNIVLDKAYYIENSNGYIYNFTTNTYASIMSNVSGNSNVKLLNNKALYFNDTTIYNLDVDDDISTLCIIPNSNNNDIVDITVMDDNRYLCIDNNTNIYELDETFTLTGITYDIPGNNNVIEMIGTNSTFVYVLTENNIYLVSTFKSSNCIDYMLPYQPSTPVTNVSPLVLNTYYIGGVKLASYWNAGTFNRGVFKYGYFNDGNFYKGIFRDGVIKHCNFGAKK